MSCVCCGSTTMKEQPERTAWGYRRFRGRDCGEQFNGICQRWRQT
jgi:hypothetical protein